MYSHLLEPPLAIRVSAQLVDGCSPCVGRRLRGRIIGTRLSRSLVPRGLIRSRFGLGQQRCQHIAEPLRLLRECGFTSGQGLLGLQGFRVAGCLPVVGRRFLGQFSFTGCLRQLLLGVCRFILSHACNIAGRLLECFGGIRIVQAAFVTARSFHIRSRLRDILSDVLLLLAEPTPADRAQAATGRQTAIRTPAGPPVDSAPRRS